MNYYVFENKVNDDMMKRILDGMYGDAFEECSKEPMPTIKKLDIAREDPSYGEWQSFMKACFSVMDKETAKTMAVRMWGVKK